MSLKLKKRQKSNMFSKKKIIPREGLYKVIPVEGFLQNCKSIGHLRVCQIDVRSF